MYINSKKNKDMWLKCVKKNERGITLLSLIITVVIMIILAAVTINVTLGDGGIIDQAKTAAEKTQQAAQSEQEQLASLEQELANILAEDSEITPPGPSTPEIGDIKPSTAGEVDILDDTTKFVDDSGDEVWIPGGFGLDEETATDADDGIVITDAKGNEFVWIPVPDYTTMYEDTAGSVKLNGVETTTSVYSKLRVRSGDTSSYTAGVPGSANVREPDLVVGSGSQYDASSQYYQDILGYGSAKLMADAFVEEYTATYNSIKKYKGFYIGRYELTGSVSNPTVQRDQTVQVGNWYNLKKACSNIVSSSYAQSEMIYGNQWDEVMAWLIKTGGKTDSEVNSNSSSWGNYSGTKRSSGYDEAWKANNIYDLAGNYYDWIQEANDTRSRVTRGGGGSGSGLEYPASGRRNYIPYTAYSHNSARSALYIKVGL